MGGKIVKSNTLLERLNPNFESLVNDWPDAKVRKNVSAKKLLFSSGRFDLIAKFLYVESIDNNTQTDWYKELYLSTISAFNNFHEFNREEEKVGKKSFLNSFDKLYNLIKTNGYDQYRGLIPVNPKGVPMDGGHRVAIAAHLGIDVETAEFPSDTNFDYEFFNKKRLSELHADYIAHSYCKLNKYSRLIFLYPSANSEHDDTIIDWLKEKGDIIYFKKIELNNEGPVIFNFHAYKGHEWLGSHENNFEGARNKALSCFSGANGLRLIMVSTINESDIIEIKNRYRQLFYIGNHSIHSTDSHEETLRCSRILLNENSVDFLNRARIKKFNNYIKLVEKLPIELKRNNVRPDEVCLEGSGTMAAYGIRDISDIDLLCATPNQNKISNSTPDIEFNSTDLTLHNKSIDEILHHPKNYFYYKDMKYISMQQLIYFKKKRGTCKDIEDIKLMTSFVDRKILNEFTITLRYFYYYYLGQIKVRAKKILPTYIANIYRIIRDFIF